MPTLGKYVEAMDDENNLLYPKTVAAQVIYSAGQMLPGKIAELEGNIRNVDQKVDNVKNEVDNAKNDNNQIYPTLKGRLDAMDTRTKTNTDEIVNARDRKGVVHPNLKARLDAMDTDCDTIKIEVEQARGGANSLGDRLTTIVNGNQTTLDEVIKARNGEVDLDARLDKMQDTITETSNRVTQAMTDDLGVTHPTLQVRLDRMRQSAARTDEEVINARTSPNFPNAPYANLKARLDAMDVGTNEIKKEISDARGAGNNTLNERLDKMQDQINIAGGGNPQEVIDAREDVDGQIHQNLKTRLDSDYNKLDNKFGNYLPLTGGTLTGNLNMTNNTGIGAFTTGGGTKLLTFVGDDDACYFGDRTAPLRIQSNSNPYVYVGNNPYLLYHEGHKPTAQDVGALPITGGTLTGNLVVQGTTQLNGHTSTGEMNIYGGLGVRDGVSIDQNLVVRGTTQLDGHTSTGSMNVYGGLGVRDGVTIGNTLVVNGNTALNGMTYTQDLDVAGTLNVTRATTLKNTLNVTGLTTLNQLNTGQTTIRAAQNALGIIGQDSYISFYPHNNQTQGSWIGHQNGGGIGTWTENLGIVCNNGAVWIRGGNGGVKLFGGNTWLDGNDLAQVNNIHYTGNLIKTYSLNGTTTYDSKRNINNQDISDFFDNIEFITNSTITIHSDKTKDIKDEQISLDIDLSNVPNNDLKYMVVKQGTDELGYESGIDLYSLLMVSMAQIKELKNMNNDLLKRIEALETK